MDKEFDVAIVGGFANFASVLVLPMAISPTRDQRSMLAGRRGWRPRLEIPGLLCKSFNAAATGPSGR